jgi:hypothetical protein
MVTSKKPVEQGGSQGPDMEMPGRAGSKSDSGHVLLSLFMGLIPGKNIPQPPPIFKKAGPAPMAAFSSSKMYWKKPEKNLLTELYELSKLSLKKLSQGFWRAREKYSRTSMTQINILV